MRRTLLATALAILPMAAAADGHTTVIATVNGTDITVADLRATLATLPEQYRQLPPETLLPGLADQVVQQAAIASAAEFDVEAEVAAYRRSLLARRAIEAHLVDAVTEDDIAAAYEAAIAGFTPATEYDASHILVETEAEAVEIIAEIEGGADFADTARERSTGPSGPRGGALGWFGAGQMVPAFDQAVQSMEPGTLLGTPVQTQFGWHVIRLNDTRDTSPPALEEVRGTLTGELQRAAATAFVAEAEAAAEIERAPLDGIDPALLTP